MASRTPKTNKINELDKESGSKIEKNDGKQKQYLTGLNSGSTLRAYSSNRLPRVLTICAWQRVTTAGIRTKLIGGRGLPTENSKHKPRVVKFAARTGSRYAPAGEEKWNA
jgi:hypothetical protein